MLHVRIWPTLPSWSYPTRGQAKRLLTIGHMSTGVLECTFFKFKDGVGQMGGLERELTDEDLEKFRRRLEDVHVDASRSWLTRWNGLSKTIEVIFGTPEPIT